MRVEAQIKGYYIVFHQHLVASELPQQQQVPYINAHIVRGNSN